MSYKLRLNTLSPESSYIFDTSPTVDHTGNGNTATLSGTQVLHAALLPEMPSCQVFNTTRTLSVPSKTFTKGQESKSFSIAAVFKVIRNSTTAGDSDVISVASHGTTGDGITITGNEISFSTKYTDLTQSTCKYNTISGQVVHVLAVHTPAKNSLYVNGVLVDESFITEEQAANTYSSSLTTLSTTVPSTNRSLALGSLAIFPSALSSQDAQSLYNASIAYRSVEVVTRLNDFGNLSIDTSGAQIYMTNQWTTDESLSSGLLESSFVSNAAVRPQVQDGTSVPAQWTVSIPIDTEGVTSIYGLRIDFESLGAEVSTSIDGGSWSVVNSGDKVPGITAGMNPTGKYLSIRATFAGGIVDDPSFISNLSITGFESGISNVISGRTVTHSTSVPGNLYSISQLNESWGVNLPAAGTLVISPDTQEGTAIRTVELWIKRTGANPTFNISGTFYQNGAPATATLVSGHWTLMHIVLAADNTTGFTITGPAQIGSIAVSDTAMSAAQISAVYNMYCTNDIAKVDGQQTIAVSQPADPANIYSHDWTINAAG